MLAQLAMALTIMTGITGDDWSAFPGDGSFAENSEHTHDPMIFKVKGVTISISTSGNGMGVVKTTKDFKTWKVHGPLVSPNPEWLQKRVPEHKSVWAPDAIVLNDRVRVYYCASRFFGGNDSVIGLLENTNFDPENPTKGWEDKGPVIDSTREKNFYNCIDAEVLLDQEGKQWLFFGSYFAGIFFAPLDPVSGKLLDPAKPPELIARNSGSRENALEGCAVIYRDGYYYMFVSYGLAAQGVRSTYQIMVGRSKSPTGPFVDQAGKSMVDGGHVNVLKTSPPMFSPGHCELMKDERGKWLMSYHYYDGRKYWTDGKWGMPRVQVRELEWSEDGWPLPGLPLEHLAVTKLPTHNGIVGKWLHQADFGNVDEVEFLEGGTLKAGQRSGFWELKQDKLTLKWPRGNDSNDV
ncbi:MAG TPA: arabinan endo-1,5-alpha-L-arabinosidase, partial [Fimbriimonas sp.]|nr:arabinan endo-1,5-alpha-L-arabinosidase [Fimbriimonas sp.]